MRTSRARTSSSSDARRRRRAALLPAAEEEKQSQGQESISLAATALVPRPPRPPLGRMRWCWAVRRANSCSSVWTRCRRRCRSRARSTRTCCCGASCTPSGSRPQTSRPPAAAVPAGNAPRACSASCSPAARGCGRERRERGAVHGRRGVDAAQGSEPMTARRRPPRWPMAAPRPCSPRTPPTCVWPSRARCRCHRASCRTT